MSNLRNCHWAMSIQVVNEEDTAICSFRTDLPAWAQEALGKADRQVKHLDCKFCPVFLERLHDRH